MTNVQSKASQAAAKPKDVLRWLQEGNERFAAGRPRVVNSLAQVEATASDQFPLAAVLSCIDSRVPVELVLDVGIGDVFVARTAGNVVGDDVVGSLEFASELAGAKAIVVLGHSACGAVRGAADGAELGSLTQLLAKITPAVEVASGGDPTPGSADPDLVERAVEANVVNSLASLREQSEVLRRLESTDRLIMTGGVYDLATGRVRWLGPPAEQ